MSTHDTHFVGSIPAIYDEILGPLMFAPYANDLAERVARSAPSAVLEIAAGTGVVTRALAKALASAQIVASDLNEAMLGIAQRQPLPRVTWKHADAQHLPFDDGAFDAVVCQFAYMFVPDKHAAYREARRVLRAGGRFVFNVWGPLAGNEVTAVVGESVARSFPDDPPRFLERTPFGYHDGPAIRSELERAGFQDIEVESLEKVTQAPSPELVARGLCLGTPLRNEIEARDPARLDAVTAAAAGALRARFGAGPFENRMYAVVISARRG
jgi:ubiquinone/menaquinone biosynthesis C-methylase UbiE